jgi:hydroxymethylglutaryl-CoA reductase
VSDSCSRIAGFYKLDIAARRSKLAERSGVSPAELAAFDDGALGLSTADGMIENVIGTYSLPLGVALNFRVNDRDFLVPMAIEEPSVVAAASYAAKMVRAGGGFTAEASDPVMIGQVELRDLEDARAAAERLTAREADILSLARESTPGLCNRGGGPVGLEVRILSADTLVVHLLIDCRDAMGANLVNSVSEAIADELAAIARGRVGLRILSNLAVHRTVRVRARVPLAAIGGVEVGRSVAEASRFAELDPFRAATHNKGIMNGVDAVLVATGQDWRGVEAGAHAFAAAGGAYRPLAVWRLDRGPGGDELVGDLAMPLAVGTVGGALHVHRGARVALALLAVDSASELAQVTAAAGLATNLAALRALATDGIQRGHMSLHARVVARAAGATGDLLERVAAEIAALGDVKQERARQILERLRGELLSTGAVAALTLEES